MSYRACGKEMRTLIDLNERTTANHMAIDMRKSEIKKGRKGEEKGERRKEKTNKRETRKGKQRN